MVITMLKIIVEEMTERWTENADVTAVENVTMTDRVMTGTETETERDAEGQETAVNALLAATEEKKETITDVDAASALVVIVDEEASVPYVAAMMKTLCL